MQNLLDVLKGPIIIKLLRTALWVAIISAFITFFQKLIKRRIDDITFRYKFQKTIELAGIFLIVVIILLSFTLDNLKDYTVIIGLLRQVSLLRYKNLYSVWPDDSIFLH